MLIAVIALSGCGVSARELSGGHTVTGGHAATGSHGATDGRSAIGGHGAGDTALRVSGNRLIIGAGAGRTVQLRGVNRSGTEYACEQGWGIFNSPTPQRPDSAALVAGMTSWDIDVVRVPLNEGCWLGTGAPARSSGARYRQAIRAYVRELNRAGLFVILDLHWLALGSGRANQTAPMADAGHAPRFWRSVAATFKPDPDVIFDLYNEPFGISWSCWLAGCEVPAGTASGDPARRWSAYRAAGMQQLVDAVRSTGARQPLLLGGLAYALDLSGWLAHEPSDPAHQLIASAHTYGGLSPCAAACQQTIVAVSQRVPVIFGELGETDCASGYIDRLMSFADAHSIGYLGWAWDAVGSGGWSCRGGPALITNYAGTPTAYGAGLRRHLRSRGVALRIPHTDN